ncbi:DUF998 domain-containing protein [Paracoccus zhejiangensis]|uniref:DUF998 domain-containing protein n=1 Tax=Paracoccus zhejiangensis TaxID=1077935 RepID=A0A2H5F2M8_9RHOB|nr:DUF998 domain-containing protein [Paracoccus zhejiangensis]AUH65810.1 DUF998 domain-containing protein [Paracoccus zhejiangensis]
MDQDLSGIRQRAENDLVLSFLAVRRAIGLLGLFLPLALIAYGILSGEGIRGSLSSYYYSPMREIFVGTLCAQAVFLWSYEGYRPVEANWLTDRNLSRAAALGAAGIALWPTIPEPGAPEVVCTLTQCVFGLQFTRVVHFAAALLFFGAMAVTFVCLFTRGDDGEPLKRGANRIYRACGWIIIAALLLIGLVQFTPLGSDLESWNPVFWLEVLASAAIATSWSVKGRRLQTVVRAIAGVR